MSISRRNFIKAVGVGAAATVVAPDALATQLDIKKTKCPVFEPMKFDVIVVGAGPGGISAAVAAARNGAKVALLEEDQVAGGAPVDMFVTYMCGGPRVGLFKQLMQNLNRDFPLNGISSEKFGEYGSDGVNHWWLPSSFAAEYRRMITAQENITLLCGAHVDGAIVKEKGNRNLVRGVRFARNGGVQEVYAPVTIDATGTGLVAATAGCQVMYGTESKYDFNESYGLEESDGKVQLCTQMYISQRVRNDAVFPIERFGSGVLDDGHRLWGQQQTREEFYARNSSTFLHWGVSIYCPDTTDTIALAEAQNKVLKDTEHYMKILNKAGFAMHLAPKIGVRECRRIKGEYVVTVDHLMRGDFPDDTIAHARYGIDAWGWKIPDEIKKAVKPYGIPYRALIPLNTEGLLTAGRIISGSRLAHSSFRVQSICSSIGEAAGTAAAMAAAAGVGVRDIDIIKLQNNLDSYGLFEVFKDKMKKN